MKWFNTYRAPGECFIRLEPQGAAADKTVLLIHGWGVRASSMRALGEALTGCGCTVYNYDYPTSRRHIAEHAAVFLKRYRALAGNGWPDGVYFVTHSMGGLVLRAAMAAMTEKECRQIRSIVMLGPPNRGSVLAYPGKLRWVRSINRSLGDMTPGRGSWLDTIPRPPVLPPIDIVAGRFDEKVALRNTLLPDDMPCRRVIVSCTHPGLRQPRHVLPSILRFWSSRGRNEHFEMPGGRENASWQNDTSHR